MAERKVLNKYYPPDFDPDRLRKYEKKQVRNMCNVRMMLPMTVRCTICGNYMYLGTKFNMKVECVRGEDYVGIKVYRFYFKCTQCFSELTFKTDPRNHDYVADWNCTRNHNPWKDMLMAEEEYNEVKKQEMKEDAMKSLEYRTYESKREMDIQEALDQVKNLNKRQARLNMDEIIEKAIHTENKVEEPNEEEEISIKEKFEKIKNRRIEDYDNLQEEVEKFDMTKYLNDKIDTQQSEEKTKKINEIKESVLGIKIKRVSPKDVFQKPKVKLIVKPKLNMN